MIRRSNRPLAYQAADGTWMCPRVNKPRGLMDTEIEWADFAFNPIRAVLTRSVWVRRGRIVPHGTTRARRVPKGRVGWVCVPISPGCAMCYASAINIRFGTGLSFSLGDVSDGTVAFVVDYQRLRAAIEFSIPPRFSSKSGDRRPKVFVCDMTDLFCKWVSTEITDLAFALFLLRPDIDWMVLTKRPQRMADYLRTRKLTDLSAAVRRLKDLPPTPVPRETDMVFPDNVWLGTSVENQAVAATRLAALRECPAGVRFLSCEPLLEPLVDLDLSGVQWTIIGGESGPRARPCAVDWIRSVRDQCAAAGLPVFVKQLGSQPIGLTVNGRPQRDKGNKLDRWPADLRVRSWPDGRKG